MKEVPKQRVPGQQACERRKDWFHVACVGMKDVTSYADLVRKHWQINLNKKNYRKEKSSEEQQEQLENKQKAAETVVETTVKEDQEMEEQK